MIVALIEEAVGSGARRARACHVVGLSVRTVERWRGTHPPDAREAPAATQNPPVVATPNSPSWREGVSR